MERRTAPVELLWDLVFVFAVTQVATQLNANLSWAGFGRAMLVLALVWWAWSAFVWATNAQDPRTRQSLRGVLFLSTLLIFVAGLALPHAFGRDGSCSRSHTPVCASFISGCTSTHHGGATLRYPRSPASRPP